MNFLGKTFWKIFLEELQKEFSLGFEKILTKNGKWWRIGNFAIRWKRKWKKWNRTFGAEVVKSGMYEESIFSQK